MRDLQPTETALVGEWTIEGDHPKKDKVCERILKLIAEGLIQLGHDQSGWYTLFLDPNDKRLWERWYPQSEMHGGGPPALRVIPIEEARSRYGQIL